MGRINFRFATGSAWLVLLFLTSCTSKETKALLEPSQALGTVLAEEAVRAAGDGIVVSLAGAPLLTLEEAARLSPQHPPVLVVATASLGNVIGVTGDRNRLAGLLEARAVQLAIVDGAPEPPAPPAAKMDSAHQLFSQHYRILRRSD